MNMKKIMAGVVASTLAVGAMAVAVSAGSVIKGTLGMPGIVTAGENWSFDLAGEGVLDGIDIADVYGYTLVFTQETHDAYIDGAAGIGGGFVLNGTQSAGKNWNAVEWGNADADKPITYDDDTRSITRMENAAYFDATDVSGDDDTWAQVALQVWWGPDPVEVESLSLLDKDGNVLKTFGVGATAAPAEEDPAEDEGGDEPAPAEETAASTEAAEEAPTTTAAETEAPAAGTGNTATTTPDKNNADTGVEGVAVVAGLAIVAAGAVIVAKKRK